jgi:thiol-disulfide isomerase/thioredoxin
MADESAALLDRAPWFDGMLGADGDRYGLDSFAESEVVVLVFAGNGCPSVRALEPWLVEFQRAYEGRGVRVVWINSNNPALSPGDTYEEMQRRAAAFAYPFPYLCDADHELAGALGATTTPHAVVLDADRRVRYRGRVADSRQAATISTPYLQNAVEDVLAGREVARAETEPYGCSIVW